jgi:type IV pilus assembly protein PilF
MRVFFLVLVLSLVACSATEKKEDEQEQNRKSAETNTVLGQEYMQRGQYEVALEKLKRAIAQDLTYSPAHTVLAVLYETLGEMDLAEKQYQEALKYDPTDGGANNNYGAFLCSIGKYKDTDQYFLKAVKDPFYKTPAIAYANAGECSLGNGDLDKAERFLRQSLEYDNKLPAALLPMAEISYQKGNYLGARAFLQRFDSVGTLNEESLLLGYQIESSLGDVELANRYRSELLERYPRSSQAKQLSGREKE